MQVYSRSAQLWCLTQHFTDPRAARACRPNASKLEVFTVPTSRTALSAAVDEFLQSLPRTTVLDRINDTLASSTFWHARVTTKLVRCECTSKPSMQHPPQCLNVLLRFAGVDWIEGN